MKTKLSVQLDCSMRHPLCWLGLHKVHYTWKYKHPYCARCSNGWAR